MTSLSRAADFPYFDNDGLPLAFAHRGGALLGDERGLENSLHAFRTAVDLGYRYVETDVHATRDGVLLAIHDPTLERTTGAVGAIGEMTYDDLRHIRIGGTEAIPLLDEVLSSWPDLKLNIDAKSASAVGLLAAAIRGHRAWDRVCVASFSPWTLRHLRSEVGPRVASSYSAPGVAALRLLPGHTMRQLLLGGSGQAAQVPVRKLQLEIVTASFIDHAHDLGKQVHVWTIDSPGEMTRLLDLGVDAVMTDRVDVLRDVYIARGIWTARRG